MKKVSGYKDSNGKLHNTAQECFEHEVFLQLVQALGHGLTAKDIAKNAYKVSDILYMVINDYEKLNCTS